MRTQNPGRSTSRMIISPDCGKRAASILRLVRRTRLEVLAKPVNLYGDSVETIGEDWLGISST